MTISHAWNLSSDAELITAVRSGESSAFGVLYERHEGAARSVARQYSNSSADAEDAVADAFSRVFSAIQDGGGPDVAFRAYLFTVIRRVALKRVDSGRRAMPTDDLETFEAAAELVESTEAPTMAGFERGVVSQAYKSLPERWQAVLWYTEVEELSPAEIAPVLGLTANGVAALAYRAREGLRQAYLQQHLAAPASEACTLVNGKLGAYVRGGLAKRETALVELHLEECGTCRALVLELGDVNHGMRVVIGPLVLGAVGVAVLKGLGFGGAAGAGVGAGAGAGAGAGGAGSGAGGAGTAGAGTAGAGAAGVAGAGAAGTGVGVGAGIGAGSGAAVLLSGAGATVAAGGGIAALIGGIPLVVGLAAVGVVAAGGLGVAGLLGVFSGPDDGGQPPSLAAPEDGGAAGTTDGTEQGDATDGQDDGTTPADPPAGPTDPTNIPDAQPISGDPPASDTEQVDGGTATPSGTGTGTTQPADPAPTSPPETTDPAPASLTVAAPSDLSFISGVPAIVQVTVTNDGDQATGVVQTEFAIDSEADLSVSVLPSLPDGGGAVRAAVESSAWTCAEPAPGASSVVCTLPDLPGRASSSLVASVLVIDAGVDEPGTVGIDIATWAPALGARPEPSWTYAPIAAPPAVITVGQPVEVGAVSSDPAPVVVVVPVSNTGATSAKHLTATVELPATLPAGTVVADVAGGWVCTDPVDSRIDCSLARLGRGETVPIELGLTAPPLDLASAAPFVDQTISAALTVDVPAAGTTVTAPVTIRSAPAVYELSVVPPVEPGLAARDATIQVVNVGGTTGTGLALRAVLPDGFTAGTGWTVCTAGFCADLGERTVPGADPFSLPLNVVVPLDAAPATYPIGVDLTDATGAVVAHTDYSVTVDEPAPVCLPWEAWQAYAAGTVVLYDGGYFQAARDVPLWMLLPPSSDIFGYWEPVEACV